MLYHAFPDLQWLKRQAESRFSNRKTWNGEAMTGNGWPNVLLNVKSGVSYRDNILGPLSLFSNVSGESFVTVDGRTSLVNDSHFFISNNTQRYTLQIKSAETFNIHFGQDWAEGVFAGFEHDRRIDAEFYNKLYPKDEVVRALQQKLAAKDCSKLEREEVLTKLVIHLLYINDGERLKIENISAAKLATRQEILRRLHLATDYIYSFYQKDLSLDELSKASMLSKFHFVRAFRQVFGVAPHKFLNQVRMERAKDLLVNTELDVMQIGNAVGVRDSSSFSRLFRNEVGVYPSAFRNFCHPGAPAPVV